MESKYLESKIKIGERLVKKLLQKYEYVSLLGKHITGKRVMVSNFNKSIGDSFENQCGFVVKVFNQGIYSEYSFSDLSEDNFDYVIKNLENLKVDESLLKEHMDLSILDDEPLVQDFERKIIGKEFSTSEIMEKLEQLKDEMVAYDKRIIQGRVGYEKYVVNSFFISKNRHLTQSLPWSSVYVVPVARKEAIIKGARSVFASINIEDNFAKAFAKAKETCQLAIDLLDSEPVVPGEYEIISAPSISGLIAHEAFGHGVEMDMFVKHRAISRKYLEKPVASSVVSMHDGAAATLSAASYFFDDDGCLAHDTLIIENGILKSGICDVIAANELHFKATGNSRRESPYHKAYTRMTNTFFSPGNDDVEDMIKSIKHGYMLFDTNNGMEDPKNWNIQCVAEYGREIKDGKFTGKLISPVVMSGNVLDLLMSISMVSKDWEVIGSGHCGKGHKEWVAVSDGGPYLKGKCKLS